MSEVITYLTQGTCSKQITVELEDDIIKSVNFLGGCPGNTVGVAHLAVGYNISEVIARLKGIPCGNRGTSCPNELALCLEKYITEKTQEKV